MLSRAQQPVALQRLVIKLRGAHAAQLCRGRISQHPHQGVVAVEDASVDRGMHDAGEIALINEVAKLVGRFQLEFAFLARRDVPENDDRSVYASRLPVKRARSAFYPETRSMRRGAHQILDAIDGFTL